MRLAIASLLLIVCAAALVDARIIAIATRRQDVSAGYMLRFYGNGVDNIDRVVISIDNPEVPADVGATDFTLEFWMRAAAADNTSPTCTTGNDNWITGNIIFDRDIWGGGDYGDFGVSMKGGQIAFGTNNGVSGDGICSTSNVNDNTWHHIAVTYQLSTGTIAVFVDGTLESSTAGPTGDLSYRNGRTTPYFDDPYLVIGAEKHDAGPLYPSYNGYIDEIRLSNIRRYTVSFSRPTTPFQDDSNTMALYHFDEGTGNTIGDSSSAVGGPSNGIRNFGGAPAGPVWVVSDAPLLGQPTTTTTVGTTTTTIATTTTTTVGGSTTTTTAPVFMTYYVDPQNGSDSNNGTSTNTPWETVPGTRTTNNTGYLRSAWGTITTSNRVACGSIILLRGGTTYSTTTVSNGGAWRIDPDHYTDNCTSSTPITFQVASNAQWSGSTTEFTIDGTGITDTSRTFGTSGNCSSGGACGLIDIEDLDYITFGGIDDSQRIAITAVANPSFSATSAILVYGVGSTWQSVTGIEIQWMDISGKEAPAELGAAISMGHVNTSIIHDIYIHDWIAAGIDTGLSAVRPVVGLGVVNVIVENSGPPPGTAEGGNFAQDSFNFSTAIYDDTSGGGGVWCINCESRNSYWNGSNSGGSNTPNLDAVVRYRNFEAYGNGRTVLEVSKQTGLESSGDSLFSANALPEQTIWLFYSTFYNNRRIGHDRPHGCGSSYMWNNTLFRAGESAASIQYEVCECVGHVYNTIVDQGSLTTPAYGRNSCGVPATLNSFVPRSQDSMYLGASDSDNVSFINSYCSGDGVTKCRDQSDCISNGACVMNVWSGAQTYSSPPGFLIGGGNLVGSTYSSDFVSAATGCDVAFQSAIDTDAYNQICNFNLLPTSNAIDTGTTYFLLADGSGSSASTITVKGSGPHGGPSDPAPYQTGASYMNWTGGDAPHRRDPRMYFIAPSSFYKAGEFPGADIIQIKNANCTNAATELGSAERAVIASMTSSTITLDRTCSWSDEAGIHLPWEGTAPDMGAREYGTGNDYYVDFGNSTGLCNDATNNGLSPSTPWCTIPGTRLTDDSNFFRTSWGTGSTQISNTNRLTAGDTVWLRAGTTMTSTGNVGRIFIGYSNGISFWDNGTANNPMSIRVSPTWGSGDVIINCSGMTIPSNMACFQILKDVSGSFGNYLQVRGASDTSRLVITNSSLRGIKAQGLAADRLVGVAFEQFEVTNAGGFGAQTVRSDWVTFKDCLVQGSGDSGIVFGESSSGFGVTGGTAVDCEMDNNGTGVNNEHGGNSFDSGTASAPVVFLRTNSHNSGRDGYDLGVLDNTNGVTYTLVLDSESWDNAEQGFACSGCDGASCTGVTTCSLVNSVLYGNEDGAVVIYGTEGGTGYITNNTMAYHPPSPPQNCFGGSGNSTIIARNNICYRPTTATGGARAWHTGPGGSSGSPTWSSYNNVYIPFAADSESMVHYLGTFYSFDQDPSASFVVWSNNLAGVSTPDYDTPPLFVATDPVTYANNDFTLGPNSSAIDVGSAYCSTTNAGSGATTINVNCDPRLFFYDSTNRPLVSADTAYVGGSTACTIVGLTASSITCASGITWGSGAIVARRAVNNLNLIDVGAYEAAAGAGPTYYVDNACTSNGDGTEDCCVEDTGCNNGAWNSLSNALAIAGCGSAGAGDTINISGGTYYESVNVAAGCAGANGNPLSIQNAPGEAVIMDGTIDIRGGSWSLVSGTTDTYECVGSGCGTTSKFPFTAWYDRGAGEERLNLVQTRSAGGSVNDYACTSADGPAAGEMRYNMTGPRLCVQLSNGSNPANATSFRIPYSSEALGLSTSGVDYVTIREHPNGGSFTIRRYRDHGITTTTANVGITYDGLDIGWMMDRCINQSEGGQLAAAYQIINNTIHNCGQEGIRYSGDTSSAGLVANNTIYEIQQPPLFEYTNGLNLQGFTDNGTGIRVTGNDGGTIRGNTIYDIGGGNRRRAYGIDLEGYARSVLVEDNYIYNMVTGNTAPPNDGNAIHLAAGGSFDGNTIRNNRMHNVDSCFAFDNDAGATSGTMVIQNNTCSNPAHYGFDKQDGAWAGTITFTNNLWIATANTPTRLINVPSGVAFQVPTYGSYYCTSGCAGGNLINWKGSTYYDDANCATNCVQDFDANSDYGNPNIDQTGSPPTLKILSATGTAYDRGVTIGTFSDDFEGDTRDTLWDIGADEYSGAYYIGAFTGSTPLDDGDCGLGLGAHPAGHPCATLTYWTANRRNVLVDGDSVRIAPGTYVGNGSSNNCIVPRANVTYEGRTAADSVLDNTTDVIINMAGGIIAAPCRGRGVSCQQGVCSYDFSNFTVRDLQISQAPANGIDLRPNVAVSNITIDRVRVTQSTELGAYFGNYIAETEDCASTNGRSMTNLTVVDSEFDNNYGVFGGAQFGCVDTFTIQRSTFHNNYGATCSLAICRADIQDPCGCDDHDGFQITGGINGVVSDNEAWENGEDNFDIGGHYKSSYNIVVERNYSHDSARGHFAATGQSNNITFRNNLCYGTGFGLCFQTYGCANNIKLYNNTFWKTGDSNVVRFFLNCYQCEFINNIIRGNSSIDPLVFVDYGTTETTTVWENNVIYNASTGPAITEYLGQSCTDITSGCYCQNQVPGCTPDIPCPSATPNAQSGGCQSHAATAAGLADFVACGDGGEWFGAESGDTDQWGAEPLIVNSGTPNIANLHLAANDTVARDNGQNLTIEGFTTDYDLETRSGTWDIGFDEVQTIYYVDPDNINCNDAATTPTTSVPWCTIPGTRTTSNSGFLNSQWGNISITNPITCGDTILLMGGSTQDSTDGGAWRIDDGQFADGSGYYDVNCLASNPITIRVATNAEWPGSTGHFTLDGTGSTATCLWNCSSWLGRAGIWIQDVENLTLGGNSSTQRLIVRDWPVSGGQDANGITVRPSDNGSCPACAGGQGDQSNLRFQYLELANNTFHGIGLMDATDFILNDVISHDNGAAGFALGMNSLDVNLPIRRGGLVDTVAYNNAQTQFTNTQCSVTGDAYHFTAAWDVWVVNAQSYDNWCQGINVGTVQNNIPQAYKLRMRNFHSWDNGVGNDAGSGRAGIFSSGDEQMVDVNDDDVELYLVRSVVYRNPFQGISSGHGRGKIFVWHAVMMNNAQSQGSSGDMRYDRRATAVELHNSIIPNRLSKPWDLTTGPNPPDKYDPVPVSNYNLYDYNTADSETFSDFDFTGSTLNWPVTRTFASPPSWIGANDLLSTTATRYTADFVSLGSNCDTGTYVYEDCDFNLQATSDAIDNGGFFLLADGGCTNCTTINVKANAPSTVSDPRDFFIAPGSYLDAVGDTIEIVGCGERVISSMTATSITLTTVCASVANNAGIHLPWEGSAPDVGRYEYVSGSTTTTITVATTTTTSGASTTTTTTLPPTMPQSDGFERSTLGSIWTQATASIDSCQIDNSSDLESTANGDTLCYYNLVAPATDGYACAQISNSTNDFAGVCLAMNTNGEAVCCLSNPTGQGWELDNFVNELWSSPVIESGSQEFAVGDYIGIRRTSATAYQCYRAAAASPTTWGALGTGGTSFNGDDPGYAGAYVGGPNVKMLETWEAGNGNIPTDTNCGTHGGDFRDPVTTTTTTTTIATTTTTIATTTTTTTIATTTTTIATTTTTTTTTTTLPPAPNSNADTCEESSLTNWNDTDPTLTTDNRCNDDDTSTSIARVSKGTNDLEKVTWNSGRSGIVAGDAFRIYVKKTRNSGDCFIVPYGTSTTVTTGNEIGATPCAGPCSYDMTITSGFLTDLADLGGGQFSIRYVCCDSATPCSLRDRTEISELDFIDN